MPPADSLDPDLLHRLALTMRRCGGRRVAGVIGVSPQTLYRVLAGRGVYGGARVAITERIGAAEALQPREKAPKEKP